MKGSANFATLVGLFLLGVIGLFPPLKRPADFSGGSTGAIGSRAFLLSKEYVFYADYDDGGRTGKPVPRCTLGGCLPESLVIVSVSGVGFIALQKFVARPG